MTPAAPTHRWTSERTLRFAWNDDVRTETDALRALPNVTDAIPGVRTLTLTVDPLRVDRADLEQQALALLTNLPSTPADAARTVDIPFCADPDLAPDLGRIAEHAGLAPNAALDLLTGATLRVALFGFAPGFAYLEGLPHELHTPRLDTPRTRVPPGSVAIAGGHAAVYPASTPGGWNIIGRTRIAMFDPRRDPPALLRTGDAVRFVRTDRDAFDAGRTP